MGVITNLFLESDAVSERRLEIPFEFSLRESLPEGKDPGDKIIITPPTVRTWFRIKPLLVQIDKKDLNLLLVKENVDVPDEELFSLIEKYDEILMEIIYISIHNKRSDMPDWFKEVLKDNCTWRDIHILLNAIVYRLGFQSFYKSITLLQGVSPMRETEIIAAQRNLKTHLTVPFAS